MGEQECLISCKGWRSIELCFKCNGHGTSNGDDCVLCNRSGVRNIRLNSRGKIIEEKICKRCKGEKEKGDCKPCNDTGVMNFKQELCTNCDGDGETGSFIKTQCGDCKGSGLIYVKCQSP